MVTYSEKLRDPRWQRVRLEVWQRADFACESCGSARRGLDVHHCYYEKGKEPWDYPLSCFLLLCERCHLDWHSHKQKIDTLLSGFLADDLERAAGLIRGMRAASDCLDVCFHRDTDGLVIASVIRGFWPPTFYQTKLIDAALDRAQQGFWLTTVVADSIPLDDPELSYLADWHKRALRRRTDGFYL